MNSTALERLLAWDTTARAWLMSFQHPLLDPVMVGLSIIGRGAAVWVALVLLLVTLDRRRMRAAATVLIALALAHLVTDWIIKPLVARPRPFETIVDTRVIDRRPGTYSFPSGHAATSLAGAIGLTWLWPAGRALFWPLAFLIAFSRIYVGVHYPVDVLCGAVLGVLCALTARSIANHSYGRQVTLKS
jgi:undecaprenyl-diphosphatase